MEVTRECVVCGVTYLPGRDTTCCQECHDKLVNYMIWKHGEFKKVIRVTTGEAFKVPLRDILESGVREEELDKYPKWEN